MLILLTIYPPPHTTYWDGSTCSVLRGVREKNLLAKLLPCVFGERDFVSYGEVLRYVVVKGDSCFIFTEESDPSPLYAIPLHDKMAILEDPNQPEGTSLTISPTFKNISKEDLDTVLLKYRGSGKIAYQFTFNKRDGSNLADGFLGVVCSSSKKSYANGVVGDKVSTYTLHICHELSTFVAIHVCLSGLAGRRSD